MKKEDAFLRLVTLLALGALLALLIPMLLLGRCAVPAADDYGYAAAARRAWEASGSLGPVLRAAASQVLSSWYGWQGTFSGIFLMALQPALFAEKLYALTPFVMLGALLLGVFSLCPALFDGVFSADRRVAVLTAAAVCLLCTQLPPSAVQGFYWWNGAIYYVFFHGLAMAAIALAIRLVRKGGAGREALLILLALFLGGGNYVTALGCAILSVGALCLTALLKTPGRRRLLLPTLALLLSFALSAAAPGNAVRAMTVHSSPGVLEAIGLSFRAGAESIRNWTDLPLLGTLLFLAPFLYRAAAEARFSFRFPALVTLFSYCLLSAMYCPPLYAMGNAGDLRLANIVYFSFVLLAALNLFYWLGWAARKRPLSPASPARRRGIALLTALLFVLSWGLSVTGGRSLCSLGAAGLLRSGEAQAYRACADRRLTVLLDRSVRASALEPFPSQPYLLYVEDIYEDPENWVNVVMSLYYDKDSLWIQAE